MIRLSRNFGHQAAITVGLDFALGDATIVMDADLQDPPEVVPQWVTLGVALLRAERRRRPDTPPALV